MREIRKQSYSYHRKQRTINIVIQIVLLILGLMWILPLMWIILTSFRAEPGSYTSYFWPKSFTLDNYSKLILVDQQFKFTKWFINTFIVAVVSCIGSTFIVLAVSYALSRLRFKMRKPMMNIALILGMFPGFMSMVAIYYILKGLGLTENPLVCLTLVYICGSGLTYTSQRDSSILFRNPLTNLRTLTVQPGHRCSSASLSRFQSLSSYTRYSLHSWLPGSTTSFQV